MQTLKHVFYFFHLVSICASDFKILIVISVVLFFAIPYTSCLYKHVLSGWNQNLSFGNGVGLYCLAVVIAYILNQWRKKSDDLKTCAEYTNQENITPMHNKENRSASKCQSLLISFTINGVDEHEFKVSISGMCKSSAIWISEKLADKT